MILTAKFNIYDAPSTAPGRRGQSRPAGAAREA
jgi:hypothetical protein